MKHITPLALLFALIMGCADEKPTLIHPCPNSDRLFVGKCGCDSEEITLPDGSTTCSAITCDQDSLCDGNCTDLTSDPNNCGKCGNKCEENDKCIASECKPDCKGDECNTCMKDGQNITCEDGTTCKNGDCYCGETICADDEFCNKGTCTKCDANATYNKDLKRCICNEGYVDMINFYDDVDMSDKTKNYKCEQGFCEDKNLMLVDEKTNRCECKSPFTLVDYDNGKFQKKCDCNSKEHKVKSNNNNLCICDPAGNWHEKSGTCVCPPDADYDEATDSCICKQPDNDGKCVSPCVPPFVWSEEANKCDCPKGTTENINHECVCNTKLGFITDPDTKECVCNAEKGWFSDGNGGCKTDCKGESKWNDELQTCECTSKREAWSVEENACVCDTEKGWITGQDAGTCYCNQDGHWIFTEGIGSCQCLSPRKNYTGNCACNAEDGWIEVDETHKPSDGNTPERNCMCDESKGLIASQKKCICNAEKGFTGEGIDCKCADGKTNVDGQCVCDTPNGYKDNGNGACVCSDNKVSKDGKCVCDEQKGLTEQNGACVCNTKLGMTAPAGEGEPCGCDEANGFIRNENQSQENPAYCTCKEGHYIKTTAEPPVCQACPDGSRPNAALSGCDCESGEFDEQENTCKPTVEP
ncbi:MAG: hypothetical protein IJ165_11280 [Proteobacteria bacterium]|nr:hypothetical protein [Pseudomonadota bacterium]